MASGSERKGSDGGGKMMVMLGAGALAVWMLMQKKDDGVQTSGNVNTGGNGNNEVAEKPESIVNVGGMEKVSDAELVNARAPKYADMKWRLQVQANMNPEYLSGNGKPKKSLRVVDWDWYSKDWFGVESKSRSGEYVGLDEYLALLIREGVI